MRNRTAICRDRGSSWRWAFAPRLGAQGIIVPSAGPINSAMAGASTAAPVDFGGSYWNPAILSGLDSQEVLHRLRTGAAEHPSAELAAGRLGRRHLPADEPVRRDTER